MRATGWARRWATALAWTLAAWLAIATGALAQTTGSSAGGGDWSSSSSSSSSSSGGYSSSYGSSSSGAASNSYEPPFGVQCLVAVAFFAFMGVLVWGLQRAGTPPKITVSAVQIAIDARARRFVQEALAKMVAEGDTASQAGLAKLLASAARALGAAKLAWIYAGAQRFDPMPRDAARATHARLALDARSRFQTELVRKEGVATRTADAPALVAREHEGEGVVIVSLVVAAWRSLPGADPARVDDLERLLSALAKLSAKELVALELIWSPAAEDDRMSTAELEALYPELTRLTAVGGRVFCGYCAGPHAAELARCPHCGAPAEAARAG